MTDLDHAVHNRQITRVAKPAQTFVLLRGQIATEVDRQNRSAAERQDDRDGVRHENYGRHDDHETNVDEPDAKISNPAGLPGRWEDAIREDGGRRVGKVQPCEATSDRVEIEDGGIQQIWKGAVSLGVVRIDVRVPGGYQQINKEKYV